MNKHAYLILVQNQPELLEYQLPLLDHATSRFIYPYRQKSKEVSSRISKIFGEGIQNLFYQQYRCFIRFLYSNSMPI